MTATRTASDRGRASRNKGARFERAVTTALRPWFPDVRRSRDNGSSTTSDTGDLAGTSPGLWWSLKDVAAAATDPPSLIAGWMQEAFDKAPSTGLWLVVQKRKGHTDPLRSWCWLEMFDLAHLMWQAKLVGDCPAGGPGGWTAPVVRMELRDVLDLLAAAGYARGAR
jgi:hypothetical protein